MSNALNCRRTEKEEDLPVGPVITYLPVIILTIILFLLGRALMLWYWRMNEIVQLLQSIDAKLSKPPRQKTSGDIVLEEDLTP
jgi:hypothetical protein